MKNKKVVLPNLLGPVEAELVELLNRYDFEEAGVRRMEKEAYHARLRILDIPVVVIRLEVCSKSQFRIFVSFENMWSVEDEEYNFDNLLGQDGLFYAECSFATENDVRRLNELGFTSTFFNNDMVGLRYLIRLFGPMSMDQPDGYTPSFAQPEPQDDIVRIAIRHKSMISGMDCSQCERIPMSNAHVVV